MRIVLIFHTMQGEVAVATSDHDIRGSTSNPGRYLSRRVVPKNLVNRTGYWIHVYAGVPGQIILLEKVEIGPFFVDGIGNQGTTWNTEHWPGVVCPKVECAPPTNLSRADAGGL